VFPAAGRLDGAARTRRIRSAFPSRGLGVGQLPTLNEPFLAAPARDFLYHQGSVAQGGA